MFYRINNNNSEEWVPLIHGLGGSIRTWKYQIDDLKDYNVIAVDLEGHGGSDFEKEKHLVARSAAEINDVLEREHIDKVHVISLSLGTLVAMEFANEYSYRVKSIVLAGFVMNLGLGIKTLLAVVEGIKYIVPKRFFYPLFANIMMPHKNHKKSRDIFIRESLKMKSVSFRMWLTELFRSQFKLKDYIKTIKDNRIPVFLKDQQEPQNGFLRRRGLRRFCRIRIDPVAEALDGRLHFAPLLSAIRLVFLAPNSVHAVPQSVNG